MGFEEKIRYNINSKNKSKLSFIKKKFSENKKLITTIGAVGLSMGVAASSANAKDFSFYKNRIQKTPAGYSLLIQRGDTLSDISSGFKQSIKKIMKNNSNIKHANKIFAGNKIYFNKNLSVFKTKVKTNKIPKKKFIDNSDLYLANDFKNFDGLKVYDGRKFVDSLLPYGMNDWVESKFEKTKLTFHHTGGLDYTKIRKIKSRKALFGAMKETIEDVVKKTNQNSREGRYSDLVTGSPYSFLIFNNGEVAYLENVTKKTYGTKNLNDVTVQVAFAGTYTNKSPSQKQYLAAAKLVGLLKKKGYGLEINTHRECEINRKSYTICPGKFDKHHLTDVIAGLKSKEITMQVASLDKKTKFSEEYVVSVEKKQPRHQPTYLASVKKPKKLIKKEKLRHPPIYLASLKKPKKTVKKQQLREVPTYLPEYNKQTKPVKTSKLHKISTTPVKSLEQRLSSIAKDNFQDTISKIFKSTTVQKKLYSSNSPKNTFKKIIYSLFNKYGIDTSDVNMDIEINTFMYTIKDQDLFKFQRKSIDNKVISLKRNVNNKYQNNNLSTKLTKEIKTKQKILSYIETSDYVQDKLQRYANNPLRQTKWLEKAIRTIYVNKSLSSDGVEIQRNAKRLVRTYQKKHHVNVISKLIQNSDITHSILQKSDDVYTSLQNIAKSVYVKKGFIKDDILMQNSINEVANNLLKKYKQKEKKLLYASG